MCQLSMKGLSGSRVCQAWRTNSCRLASARSFGVGWSFNSSINCWRRCGRSCLRRLFNSESFSESSQSRSAIVRGEFAEADLGADRSAVFAGEFMSFTLSPFFGTFALKEPGGGLPLAFHGSADCSQSLEAGRRFGLFDCGSEIPVGALAFVLAAADPIPQRLGRDAGEVARRRAIRAELDHGEELFLDVGSEFGGAADGIRHKSACGVRGSECGVRIRNTGRGSADDADFADFPRSSLEPFRSKRSTFENFQKSADR
jgi:hypothetical protein